MRPGHGERRASSPGLNAIAAAATLAARWPGSPVPGMASTCGPRCSVQASRTCAGVAPCAAAISSTSAGSPAAPVPAPPPRPGAGDREERHERDALLTAGVHERVLVRAGAEPVPVLHAHHRGDRPGLGQLRRRHPGHAQVPDQPGPLQLGQRAERLGDRGHAGHHPQVHHVEHVPAELPQVLLNLAAQLVRPGRLGPPAGRVAGRADLGHDDQPVRVRAQRRVDQLVGRAQRGEVERGRVDVVDAEFGRAAQHRDGLVPVARHGVRDQGPPGLRQPHRAEPHPVHFEVAEPPGPRGRGARGRGRRARTARLARAAAVAHRGRLPTAAGNARTAPRAAAQD